MLNEEGDKKENFRLWRERFHTHCLTEWYQNPAKDPTTDEHDDHYIEQKRPLEIATLKQCLPDRTLKILSVTIKLTVSPDDKKPWKFIEKLENHFVGVQTTMADRFIF